MSRPGPGVFCVSTGSNVAIEQDGREALRQVARRFPRHARAAAPRRPPRPRRRGSTLERRAAAALARGDAVVRAAVDPEQLRVAADLRADVGRQRAGVRQDALEHRAHLEVVGVALVVVDVAAGERRQIEVPGQQLLAQRQAAEAVGVDLHDGHVVYVLEKIPPRLDSLEHSRPSRRAAACRRPSPARARSWPSARPSAAARRARGTAGAAPPAAS